MAAVLSGATITERQEMTNRMIRDHEKEICGRCQSHRKKIMSAMILHVLKLSKLAVSGSAIKSGIERTNSTVASSVDASNE